MRSGRTAGTPTRAASARKARPRALFGGFEIGAAVGQPTGYWVGDYVMEPENGGVGVIAHETGHDYGLPDEYDTTYAGEAASAFWTIMSSGSYGGDNSNGIGNWPIHFNAWDKFQLGWLNYEVAVAGQKSEHKLGPEEYNSKQAQGLFVVLPKKAVTQSVGAPAEGAKFYYSGTGDDLDTTMTKSVTLPAGTVDLTAQVRYNIEADWDYAYLTVNGDPVVTNLSTETSPNGQNFGHGITGPQTSWTTLTADLSAYAGQTVTVGFRYWTDGAQQGQPGVSYAPGFQVDAISVPACRSTARRPTARSRSRRRRAASARRPAARRPTTTSTTWWRTASTWARTTPFARGRTTSASEHEGRLGRALPLPGRRSRLVLGHLAVQQQRRSASG